MSKIIDVRNQVCHCNKGTSDKVYIASIRENADGTFSVVGKWGRNGKLNLMEMTQCTVKDFWQAISEQRKLFESKLAKGYIDITSSLYKGDVTYNTPCIKNNLEGEYNYTNVDFTNKKFPNVQLPYVQLDVVKTKIGYRKKVNKSVESKPIETNNRRRFNFDL